MLYAKELPYCVALQNIRVPERLQNLGIGSSCVKKLQWFSQRIGKPLRVDFSSDDGKYDDLVRFYFRHGFRWTGNARHQIPELEWTFQKPGDLKPIAELKTAISSSVKPRQHVPQRSKRTIYGRKSEARFS
ncbi:hypothetical protein EPO05_05965 [Patescibacteria group bacterium]|nr:MAG: hypothetical protein EPO05_05965 [Patescibacteria group bacterium]